MKNNILLVVTIVIFIVINFLIVQKEQVLSNGKTILFNLAPRDPRSLMQGDYMVLRYRLAQEILNRNDLPTDGHIVVETYGEKIKDNDLEKTADRESSGYMLLGSDWLAFRYLQEYKGEPLTSNQHLLRYRKRHGDLQISSGSFFFQEGHAKDYENARYGEVKVTDSGDAVLYGLRDENFRQLKNIYPEN